MPVPAKMQHLPRPVIEGIVRHLCPTWSRPDYNPVPTGLTPIQLLPVMHLCRAWREEACRLFYRYAEVTIVRDCQNEPVLRYPQITLAEAAANGHAHRVVHLYVALGAFRNGCIRRRETLDFMTLLRACGPLPAVRTVLFGIDPTPRRGEPTRPNGYILPKRDIRETSNQIASAMGLLRQMLPRVVHVAVSSAYIMGITTQQFVHQVFGLVGPQTTGLGVTAMGDTGSALVGLTTGALTTLTISGICSSEHGVALVRRHAESLVHLRIEQMQPTVAAHMFASDSTPPQVIAYPRLERLYATSCRVIPDTAITLPRGSPFKCLKTLCCPDTVLFNVASVLLANSAHLQCVIVDVPAVLPAALASATFPAARWVDLRRAYRDTNHSTHSIFQLASRFPNAATVCMLVRNAVSLELGLETINLPSKLRTLDLCRIRLTVEQVAGIATTCPLLLTLTAALEGPADPPADHVIGYLQRTYGERASRLRRLNLTQMVRDSTPHLCELVVLLASIIPSIEHVDLPVPEGAEMDRALHDIRDARARWLYWDQPHLDRVRYVGYPSMSWQDQAITSTFEVILQPAPRQVLQPILQPAPWPVL